MRKIHFALIVTSLFATQQIFADMTSENPSCMTIAKACVAAGFIRNPQTPDKKFWHDCMKPVIMGQTVTGVTIDPATVKDCRTQKIAKIKKDLQDFQSVQGTTN